MTKKTRRRIDAGLKAKIALEALQSRPRSLTLLSGMRSISTRYMPEEALQDQAARAFDLGVGRNAKRRMSGRSSGCTPISVRSRWSAIFPPGGPEYERAGPQSDARPR